MLDLYAASSTPRRKEPEVVVFNDSTIKSTATSSSSKRHGGFMSSKISKINEKPKVAPTKRQKRQESEDDVLDRQVSMLMANSASLIENVSASQLTGKDRKKHNLERLTKLGLKAPKAEHAPRNIRYEKEKYRQSLAKKQLQDAKDRGVLTDTVKKEIQNGILGKKQPKQKQRVRGLKETIGRYRDGTLTISQEDIERITSKGGNKSSNHGKSKKRKRR